MRSSRWIGMLLVLVLVVAACGDDDAESTEATEATTEATGAETTAASETTEGAETTAAPETTASAEPVELEIWVFEEGGIGTLQEELESAFEAAYPNVDLVYTAFPEENYGVKIQTAIAAGQPPDLALVFGPDQMRQGLLLPLSDFLAEKGLDLSTFTPSIVEPGDEFSCNWEGELYCLGSYTGSVQLMYNKDMFDAAGIPYPSANTPMTPQEFFDLACQLTDEENGVWGAGVSDPVAFMPWETWFDETGTIADGYVNTPENIAIFDAMAQAVQNGCIPSGNIFDPWEQGRDFFSSGQLAMVITDFQDLEQVETAGINFGAAVNPTPPGYDPYFSVWTDSIGVMADTDNPQEALEYVYFLATEGQRIRYEQTGDLPLAYATAEELGWVGDSAGRAEGLEVLSHARPAIFIPNRWDTIAPIWDAWGLVSGGEMSAQDALDDAAGKIQENLDQNWRVWEEGAE